MTPSRALLSLPLFAAFLVLACSSSGGNSGNGGAGCHSDSDCPHGAPNFETCVRVEDPQCGGIGFPPRCAANTDCADAGAGYVCAPAPCGRSSCVPPCKTDADCGASASTPVACDTGTGQCVAKPCQQSTDCPANFACTGTVCTTKTCKSDGECSGACVNGVCSSQIGMCRTPAA